MDNQSTEDIPLPPPLGDWNRRPTSSDVRQVTGPIFQYTEIKRRARLAKKKGGASWSRFNGASRARVSVQESLKNIALSSFLNVLFLAIPIAWAAQFSDKFDEKARFTLNFLSMIPLAAMFDYGGEQLALYCGRAVGDLIIVTMNNYIEAALAIVLLINCELKLLQSTVVGVVMLHLLLIPGMTFLTGGKDIWEQQLTPHTTQLNQSLLTVAVMALVLPSAYFTSLDRGLATGADTAQTLVTDKVRGEFLQISRAAAIFLLVVYSSSRIFLRHPPGEDKFAMHPDTPEALRKLEMELQDGEPETNSWVMLAVLSITVVLAGFSAEFLIKSIEPLREADHIGDEWFGIILLPICSFSADGTVAIIYFCRQALRMCFGTQEPPPPSELAKARSIDGSIQFLLYWFPMFVLIAWWTGRPLIMLFDMYEIALLLTASFMVNYITQDSKTNWVEGLMMVAFYILIAFWTWFYTGQPEVKAMLACRETVAAAIAEVAAGGGTGITE